MERRLAAIMLTDMVGYSRLMGLSEEGTIARQKAHRHDIFAPKIAQHGGRIVKSTGDGLLVDFPSVVDAIRCAVEVQTELARLDDDVPEDQQIQYRIGVNLGDIVVDGGDILGDGVNVAARLEALAKPGGICISGSVHDQLVGKTELAFEDAGEQTVKNVPRPIRVWHWLRDFKGVSQSYSASQTSLGSAIVRKPSIAVLPFANMSNDEEQEFFTDGITEDITTTLSKFGDLFVISRTSAFVYKGQPVDPTKVARELAVGHLLQGSARWGKNRVRISAQLVDGETGESIWAERYDRNLDDMFELQDEITEQIVRAIEPEIGSFERKRAARTPPANLDAWGFYQQGLTAFYESSPQSFERSVALFDKATEIDSQFACAIAMAAAARTHLVLFDQPEDRGQLLQDAKDQADHAMILDPNESICLYADARVSSFSAKYDVAIEKLHRALVLNPNFGLAHYQLGYVYLVSGQADRAREQFLHLQKLSPLDAMSTGTLTMIAIASFDAENYSDAIRYGELATEQANPRIWALAFLAASLFRVGREQDAKAVLDRLYKLQPKFSVAFVRQAGVHWAPNVLQHRLKALEELGIADQLA